MRKDNIFLSGIIILNSRNQTKKPPLTGYFFGCWRKLNRLVIFL